jgi:formylglycine-generating enzyme required for sulfatase activity
MPSSPGVIAGLDRQRLMQWYRRNRKRTAEVFALVSGDAFYERPIPLRHPFVFYEGHIPAFSHTTLNVRGLGEAPVDPAFQRLFERGIDPGSVDDAKRHNRSDWPERRAIEAFLAECDRRVLEALQSAAIDNPSVPSLVRAQAAYTILEHEAMHQETTTYIVHQLDEAHKRRMRGDHRDHEIPRNEMRSIAAGIATLGAERDEIPFGWDNEFERREIEVPSFSIATYPVTNGDWLRFVEDGGPIPHFWREIDGERRLRLVGETIRLPLSWPVYVTHKQAMRYAQWAGTRLPTEAEYHRAAFGTPTGDERAFPWGSELPEPRYGNFDGSRFDPEPVDAHPDGNSAWGVADLVGNGWEWTATPFAPLPGFVPMASYPQYSADFVDGRHYLMKGASPVTPRELIRRSFRNWFFDDYPYMYAKFRCVAVR